MRTLSLLCLFLCSFTASGAEIDLARLQTAFIEKMIQYVEWPAYESEVFVISCRHDNRELLASLRGLEDKIVFGKSIKVEGEKTKNSQIILVRSTQSQKISSTTAGILIISDDPEGLSDDSMINFYLEDGKLRFDINYTLAQEKGLKINSRLLKLARYVK